LVALLLIQVQQHVLSVLQVNRQMQQDLIHVVFVILVIMVHHQVFHLVSFVVLENIIQLQVF
jgi:hypothetical protein